MILCKKEVNNRGYITVFLTLLLSGLLLVFAAVYMLVKTRSAKGVSAMALRSSMSSVRAEYNRYLYDQYHVLLLDSDMDGEGTGRLEAEIETRLSENLGEEFTVKDVQLTGAVGLMDNDLEEFNRQVEDIVPYLAMDYGVDYLKEKVKGCDSPVTEENFFEGDENSDGGKIDGDENPEELAAEQGYTADEEEQGGTEETSDGRKKGSDYDDPRDKTKELERVGVAGLIAPEDMEVTENVLKPEELPSFGKTGILKLEVDTRFKSFDRLKQDSMQTNGWLDGVEEYAAGLIYASNCFNCLTKKVQKGTALELEMEYLIAGKTTDLENYRSVVNKIIVIRLACNFAYILTDAEKMALCMELASSISWFFPPAIPVVKYLIAGAWSYLESVADAYRLVHGKKTPYLKTSETWITGLEGLSNYEEALLGDDVKNGLDYKDYLMILMAMDMNAVYYRMLDVMQVNVAEKNIGEDGSGLSARKHTLDMKDAITAFGISAVVEYEGVDFTLEEEIGY